jgi:hypothetical protein
LQYIEQTTRYKSNGKEGRKRTKKEVDVRGKVAVKINENDV